ncbi:DinB family protein [Deinococcus altitudinis]|uniref:DinB family protein n=1 Tax=Deinococcus altitudinis TaxID=468914 RepID=UPI0038918753
MSGLDALLLESFSRNGRVNAAMLAALTPSDLALEDGPEGNSIGELLAHMAGFRRGWLENISPPHAEGLSKVNDAADAQTLGAAFSAGDAAALKAVQDALAEGRAFADPWKEGVYASDPAHFLQHTIVHDSHHRGQIAALLRQSGWTKERLESLEEATWPIWRE